MQVPLQITFRHMDSSDAVAAGIHERAEELERLGWQIDVVDLGEGFPWPSDATRAQAVRRPTHVLPRLILEFAYD